MATKMGPVGYRDEFLRAITDSPFAFLHPSQSLHDATILTAKDFLDPLAADISETQLRRQAEQRRKRKRNERKSDSGTKPLAFKAVYTNGFEPDQVWAQARRILDTTAAEVRDALSRIAPADTDDQAHANSASSNGKKIRLRDDRDSAFDAEDGDPVDPSADSDRDDAQDSEGSAMYEDAMEKIEDGDNLILDDDDGDLEEGDFGGGLLDDPGQEAGEQETYTPDRAGLNDGFFSIDDFNKQSDFLEQRDNLGEDDGAGSDEEDVDWSQNPLAAGSGQGFDSRKQRRGSGESGESSEQEEDGPTFGNGDLGDASDMELGSDAELAAGMPALSNTNDVLYADFFAPPPRQLTKPNRQRALPKTQPPTSFAIPKEDEIKRAIADVRRDIFEDDDRGSDASDAQREPRSSHEKRQAELTAEIRRLEAEAVAEKPWTMSGEARAGDRPLNSLLEEDLEFERAGKPVPVITAEVSEDIESLIKRRIINREFDEVIRRRPGTVAAGNEADVRRGRIELDDNKPTQGLAELYEADLLKEADPSGYVDKKSDALKKQHEKIEELWRDVSTKLDALTNLNFRPKAPEANIKILSDVPTIMMEDARPNAGPDLGQSMLAPQEIYKAGESRNKKAEVATRSGLPVSREEMTREEKVRRRRREKERIKKAGGVVSGSGKKATSVPSKKTAERNQVAADLKKGGVKVIGKKGEIQDVEGRKVKSPGGGARGAGVYKL